MSDLMDSKSDKEIAESMLTEIAKSRNEIECAKRDLIKAESRLRFLIMLGNKLINRYED